METIELNRLAMIYKKGLNDIRKHLKIGGGGAYHYSGAYAIAERALKDGNKED